MAVGVRRFDAEALGRVLCAEFGLGDGDINPRHPRSLLSGGGDGVTVGDGGVGGVGDGDAAGGVGDGDIPLHPHSPHSRHPHSPHSRHPRSLLSGGGGGDIPSRHPRSLLSGGDDGAVGDGDGDATVKLAVAFSGGRDSTVLLHALVALRQRHKFALRALHFDHGLAAESAQWAAHCRAQCRAWEVEFAHRSEALTKPPGGSLEAHARRRRYRWFARALAPGEILLTAHHADDQAETVLLNLLRGGGPESLAGIWPKRRLAAADSTAAVVARPLLAFPAAALADYARAHDLRWIDDPANDSPEFDRNYLRAAVMPALRRRWPGAVAALNASAAHCRAAAELLAEDDARAFAKCRADALRGVFCLAPPLTVEALRALGGARAIRVLRHWIHGVGLRAPSAAQLGELHAQVFAARARAAALRWSGVEIRHYRGHLYLIGTPPAPPSAPLDWDLRACNLAPGLRVEVATVGDGGIGDGGVDGDLSRHPRSPHSRHPRSVLSGGGDIPPRHPRSPLSGGSDIPPRHPRSPLSGGGGDGDGHGDCHGAGDGVIPTALDPQKLRGRRVQWAWRCGGERMQLPGRAHRHQFKKLLQQTATPPWERRALPHLTVDGEIAWAARIGPAAAYAAAPGAPGIAPRFTVTRAGCA